jgi:hypothetical protein
VFVVLGTARLVDDEVVVGETHLYVGPNYVVSVRHGASSTYTPVRERCEKTRAAWRMARVRALRVDGLHRRSLPANRDPARRSL